MKPIYSNMVNVSFNVKETEYTLNFFHVYGEHNAQMIDGKMSDVSATLSDNIASILINREIAEALYECLGKALEHGPVF